MLREVGLDSDFSYPYPLVTGVLNNLIDQSLFSLKALCLTGERERGGGGSEVWREVGVELGINELFVSLAILHISTLNRLNDYHTISMNMW